MYYEIKLVTFDINAERNLIVQFPVLIQLYIHLQLISYQIKTVAVPFTDLNKETQYVHLQVNKAYIALNSETYISQRNQELRTCTNRGYEFDCVEHFVVKHKSECVHESVIYFNLGMGIIKEYCNFTYYFNNTNIKPAMIGGGNQNYFSKLAQQQTY